MALLTKENYTNNYNNTHYQAINRLKLHLSYW